MESGHNGKWLKGQVLVGGQIKRGQNEKKVKI